MKKLATLILVLIIASINALGQTVYISTGSSEYHISVKFYEVSSYRRVIWATACHTSSPQPYRPNHQPISDRSQQPEHQSETADIWELLDTMEVFKRPTADEIWEDFKNASIAKQDTVETTTVSDSIITTPQTDEIWESYENAVRYINYKDASYLERTYLRIERLLYANKREMRSLPKDSNELQLKKLQIKVMKSKMEEIDNKYFELTNKYIYQG